jgi:hypothetical protein
MSKKQSMTFGELQRITALIEAVKHLAALMKVDPVVQVREDECCIYCKGKEKHEETCSYMAAGKFLDSLTAASVPIGNGQHLRNPVPTE